MNGLISTQVLQEFSVTVIKKIPKPLASEMVKQIISDLLKWEVIINDGDAILEALDIQARHGSSFWDALIIQAARRGNAKLLYSEDLQHGQRFGDLTIQNPFLKA